MSVCPPFPMQIRKFHSRNQRFTDSAFGKNLGAKIKGFNAVRSQIAIGSRSRLWLWAIPSDRKRGNGLLQNELYIGRLVLNRTTTAVDSVTRRVLIRPNRSVGWVIQEVRDLRTVDQALCERVEGGPRRFEGIAPVHTRRPRHLLSGLGECYQAEYALPQRKISVRALVRGLNTPTRMAELVDSMQRLLPVAANLERPKRRFPKSGMIVTKYRRYCLRLRLYLRCAPSSSASYLPQALTRRLD